MFRWIFIALLGISVSAFALESNASRISTLETQVAELKKQLEEGPTKPASPDVKGDDWQIGLDILYWMARVEGTEFAYTNDRNTINLPILGETIDVDLKWKWGLRAFVSRFFDYDGWDFNLNFTYFTPRGSNSTAVGNSNTRIPLKGANITATGVNQAKSQFALDFYNLDGELGRNYFISGRLTLRPFIGIRTTWMNQKQITHYSGGPTLGMHTDIITDSNKFWGMGPRFGLNTDWILWNNFRFIGNVAGAVLYGYFNVKYLEEHTVNVNDKVNLRFQKHRFAPTMQGQLGLGWQSYINQKKQYVTLGLFYEVQYWWSQNQMLTLTETSPVRYQSINGDVGFQGLVIRAAVTF